jgi:hypothetical protein
MHTAHASEFVNMPLFLGVLLLLLVSVKVGAEIAERLGQPSGQSEMLHLDAPSGLFFGTPLSTTSVGIVRPRQLHFNAWPDESHAAGGENARFECRGPMS